MKTIIILFSLMVFTSYLNAQEICNNGIDDDGDGLIDCLDPDCTSSTVPTETFFNTATNGFGSVLPGGSNDNNWQISTDSITGPYMPAIVMSATPSGYYTGAGSDCGWISHSSDGMHSVNMDYYYKMEFYLPCSTNCGKSFSDSATFCLSMDLFVDNSIDEVYVNGIPQSSYLSGIPATFPYIYTGYDLMDGLSFSLCGGWHAGLNVLIFKTSSGPNYEGFLVKDISIDGGLAHVTITQPPVICIGTLPITLSASTPGGVWSGAGIIDTTLGVFDQNTLSPGTYIVSYTISGVCILNDTATIVVDTTPTVKISTPLPDACLSAPAFDLISYGYGSGGYWEGAGITNASLGTFHPSLTGGTGTYLITYNMTGACGLVTDSAYINVVSIYNSTIATTASPCVNSPILNLNAYTPGGVWSGSGIIDGTAGKFDPSFSGAGIHEINYTISGLCGSSDTALINVLALPTAHFILLPATTVSINSIVNFTNTSIGAISWTWNFGDTASTTNTSNVQSPTHTYANAGTYCVLLAAANINGCSDTTTYWLLVTGEASIKIPNVFTPNGDGNNDVFYFEASGIKGLKCTLFDRWGIKVTELNGVGESNGWNGENKNNNAINDGTYYYIIEATSLDNNIIKKEGFVQLIKE